MIRTKPLLRGVSHQIAAAFAVVGCVALVALAPGPRAKTAAAIYGVTLIALFTISAAYHRPMWSPEARALWKRVDHATIFVFIAGTYTPFCLLLPSPTLLLALTWGGATLGVLRAVFWPNAPRPLAAALYVLLGWIIVPFIPALYATVGAGGLALLFAGGIAYTAGAFIYARRWPDPAPRVFGYHEVFHALVVLAAVLHFGVVTAAVRALR